MARIIDYNQAPHELLGTGGDDRITLKTHNATVVFGGGGNDIILSPVDALPKAYYGGISLPDGHGGYFGHLMPDISRTAMLRLWADDGDDEFHIGDGDTTVGGGGADFTVLHPDPGGYHAPAVVRGFNPAEGDALMFAHDEGFGVTSIRATLTDNGWRLTSVKLVGRDSDPLLNGEVALLDFTTDGRGRGVNPLTGAGDHVQYVPDGPGGMEADIRNWLRDHDGGHYSPGADDAFIF